jgi:hypothetical protein
MDRLALSILPARAIPLVRNTSSWRVLAALGHYATDEGLCYPSQSTLSQLTGLDQAAVSRAIKDLHDLGLLRMLQPIGPKLPGSFQKQNRYQLLWQPDSPLPGPNEREITWGSRVRRW